MTTRRLAKAAEAIRETVATTVLFGLRDPRVKNVTILRAEAAPDLKTAKVYVSIMGTPQQQSLCLHGLESARGFIQAKLADRLQTRYTPVLTFVLDPGVKRSIEASRLLREVLPNAEEGEESLDDDLEANEEANETETAIDNVETNIIENGVEDSSIDDEPPRQT